MIGVGARVAESACPHTGGVCCQPMIFDINAVEMNEHCCCLLAVPCPVDTTNGEPLKYREILLKDKCLNQMVMLRVVSRSTYSP